MNVQELKQLINEELRQVLMEVKENFETFAKNRLAGAEKIIKNAKEKGGDALLTYNLTLIMKENVLQYVNI